jgi:hypothetical protein
MFLIKKILPSKKEILKSRKNSNIIKFPTISLKLYNNFGEAFLC